MKLNERATRVTFDDRGATVQFTPEQELRRAVMACMLFENQFYESGIEIADRIRALVPQCRPDWVAACAYHARKEMKVRHAPLMLMREMARYPDHKGLLRHLLPEVIQRPDELTDFLALYWKDNKGKRQPLSAQVKKGLAAALLKFDAYTLAKYDRDNVVKLRDVLFLTHAKPSTPEQEALFKQLAERTLETPDTWEVALSGGADKKQAFERLMLERKLGALAFLRNLRNMYQVQILKDVVWQYGNTLDFGRILPFQFIAAARAVPGWEDMIEPWMLKCLDSLDKIGGRTALVVDVSGSMSEKISAKSQLARVDAACGVAILARELFEDILVFSFSNHTVAIPPRRGFALAESIVHSQTHGGTDLARAVEYVRGLPGIQRAIVLTDEQSQTGAGLPPAPRSYMVNVGSYRNGVGYGDWMRIDGWSEAVLEYIRFYEGTQDAETLQQRAQELSKGASE